MNQRGDASRRATSQREHDHRRSLHHLAFIMGSYLILITPYICCGTYLTVTGEYGCGSTEVMQYFVWSPYFVCATNPLMVILAQKEFRRVVKSLFKRSI
jgi:hypothetical protein